MGIEGQKVGAFTLIELMIVIGIMAVVVAMGIPMVYHALHKEGLTKAVNDVEEVLNKARERAIMQGTMTEAVFHPKELRVEVAGGGGPRPSANDSVGLVEPEAPAPANSGLSAEFAHITIEMLDINLSEYKDAEVARVRFYPNGTCDELKIVLANESKQFGIELEVTTGLASVVPDIRVWQRR
jgi:prepilin-type N-terminal cleavage/methylation domain-containing protein